MAKVILPQSAMDTDTNLQQLAMSALMKGAHTEASGDYVAYNVSNDKLSLQHAQFVFSKGGDVTEYPLFIKCNPEDLVPEGLFGSEKFDEEGKNLGQKTWTEWCRPNNSFIERDGKTYLGTNANTGKIPNLSLLIPVFSSLVSELPVDNNIEE